MGRTRPETPEEVRARQEFGRRLVVARNEIDVTQEDVSKGTGIAQGDLSSLENGKKRLRLGRALLLLRFYWERRVSLDYLIAGKEPVVWGKKGDQRAILESAFLEVEKATRRGAWSEDAPDEPVEHRPRTRRKRDR